VTGRCCEKVTQNETQAKFLRKRVHDIYFGKVGKTFVLLLTFSTNGPQKTISQHFKTGQNCQKILIS
jgi:hypothetical protein